MNDRIDLKCIIQSAKVMHSKTSINQAGTTYMS